MWIIPWRVTEISKGSWWVSVTWGIWEMGRWNRSYWWSNLDNIERVGTWARPHKWSVELIHSVFIGVQGVLLRKRPRRSETPRQYRAQSSDTCNQFWFLSLFIQMAHSTGSRSRGLHQTTLPPSLTMPLQLMLRSPVTCCWHCSTNPTGIKRISPGPQGLCSGSSGSRIPMEVSLLPRCQNHLPLHS